MFIVEVVLILEKANGHKDVKTTFFRSSSFESLEKTAQEAAEEVQTIFDLSEFTNVGIFVLNYLDSGFRELLDGPTDQRMRLLPRAEENEQWPELLSDKGKL